MGVLTGPKRVELFISLDLLFLAANCSYGPKGEHVYFWVLWRGPGRSISSWCPVRCHVGGREGSKFAKQGAKELPGAQGVRENMLGTNKNLRTCAVWGFPFRSCYRETSGPIIILGLP